MGGPPVAKVSAVILLPAVFGTHSHERRTTVSQAATPATAMRAMARGSRGWMPPASLTCQDTRLVHVKYTRTEEKAAEPPTTRDDVTVANHDTV